MKSIGERIKDCRKIKGFTQEQLAKATRISVMSIRRYESGERLANVEILQRIANALGISLSDLTNAQIFYGQDGEFRGVVGYEQDVRPFIEEKRSAEMATSEDALCALFRDLNVRGKKTAIERVQELTEIPKYKK